jgi:hypothetical protein
MRALEKGKRGLMPLSAAFTITAKTKQRQELELDLAFSDLV